MTVVEQLRATVQQQQAAAKAQRRQHWAAIEHLWQQCCQFEGLDIEAQHSALCQDNPYLAAYHEAIAAYLAYADTVLS